MIRFSLGSLSLAIFLLGSLAGASAYAATPSVNGAKIPGMSSIVDSTGATWTLVSQVAEINGAKAGVNSGVVSLLYLEGSIYQENTAGLWFKWGGSNWGGKVADPRVVSASGTKITTTGHLVDSKLNVWAISGNIFYENGLRADGNSGVTTGEYYTGNIYCYTTGSHWFEWANSIWNQLVGTPGSAFVKPTPTPSQSATPTPTPTATATSSATGNHVAMDDMEVLPIFPSWGNAKTGYGAKGDGTTDDTAALNRAFTDISNGKISVIYLPAGTYKITGTLNLKGMPNPTPGGVSIVGDAPSTTKIKWAGAKGGTMILQNGGFNTSYSRLTLDGSSLAQYGIAQWWNALSGLELGGSSEHVDMVFQDMYIGIMAGRLGADYHQLDSEGQIRRVTFLRMGFAGLDTGEWNALDWWVWDSVFEDCHFGVTNQYSVNDPGQSTVGAGAFYVYRSLFLRSTAADAEIVNPGWISMHQNVSIGSKQFYRAENMNSGGPVILEGNRVVQVGSPAVYLGNSGPLTMIDNQFQSPETGAMVQLTKPDADVISVGNHYTTPLASVFELATGVRKVSISDTQVSGVSACVPSTAGAQSACAPLISMPGTPSRPNPARKIFEVPLNGTTAQIQAAINAAAAAAEAGAINPIVHLPASPYNGNSTGSYDITSTLNVPAKARIQIVGDSMLTNLQWHGPSGGYFFKLNGPSYATVRNMQLFADNKSGAAFDITEANQTGGRIFFEGSINSALTVSGLSETQITAQANTGFAGLNLSGVSRFVTMGTGGIGPIESTGNSNVVISDTWYEGSASALFRMDSGNFTYVGGQITPANHLPAIQPIVPAIQFNNFKGNAAFIGFSLDLDAVPNGLGIQIEAENASTNVMIMGGGSNNADFYQRTSSGGNVGMISDRTSASKDGEGIPFADTGTTSSTFITNMLAQIRSLVWDNAPSVQPAGATDVRIYRVTSTNTIGSTITSGN